MKKLTMFLIILTIILGASTSAFAFARRPDPTAGSTVNVYVNNATAKSDAYWACLDANFKKASTLDANGKVIPGSTDYAKQAELNKSCGSPV